LQIDGYFTKKIYYKGQWEQSYAKQGTSYENIVKSYLKLYSLMKNYATSLKFTEFERLRKLADEIKDYPSGLGYDEEISRTLFKMGLYCGDFYSDLVKIYPNEPRAHFKCVYYLGSSNYLTNPKSAKKHLEIAIKLKPDYADARLLLGEVYNRLGEYDKAISHCQLAIKFNDNLEIQKLEKIYEVLGNAHERKELYNEAIINYKMAIKLSQNPEQYFYDLAKTYELSGQLDEALYYYKESKLKPNKTLRAYLIDKADRAIKRIEGKKVLLDGTTSFIANKMYGEAILQAEKALKISPDLPDAYSYLFLCYLVKKDYEKAVDALEESFLSIIELESLGPFVTIFDFGGELKKNSLPETFDTAPKLIIKAADLMSNKKFGESENLLLRAAELNPDYPFTYFLLAIINGLTKREKEAEKYLKKILEIQPDERWVKIIRAHLQSIKNE